MLWSRSSASLPARAATATCSSAGRHFHAFPKEAPAAPEPPLGALRRSRETCRAPWSRPVRYYAGGAIGEDIVAPDRRGVADRLRRSVRNRAPLRPGEAHRPFALELRRASCRERVWPYVKY